MPNQRLPWEEFQPLKHCFVTRPGAQPATEPDIQRSKIDYRIFQLSTIVKTPIGRQPQAHLPAWLADLKSSVLDNSSDKQAAQRVFHIFIDEQNETMAHSYGRYGLFPDFRKALRRKKYDALFSYILLKMLSTNRRVIMSALGCSEPFTAPHASLEAGIPFKNPNPIQTRRHGASIRNILLAIQHHGRRPARRRACGFRPISPYRNRGI